MTRNICKDTRWRELTDRYANDLQAFAVDVLGMELTQQQIELYEAVLVPGSRVSLASNIDPVSRDDVSPLAPIALWNLLCRPASLTTVAIPLGGVLLCSERYAALAKSVDGPAAWVREYLQIAGTEICLAGPDGGRVVFLAANRHQPQNLAGFSGPRHLWLLEGASDFADICHEVIGATLRAERDSRLVLHARQGRFGSFVNLTRNELSKASGGRWDVITIDSPDTSKQPAKAQFR